MKSLRRGLTVWLLAALGIVGMLCVAAGTWQTRQEIQAQLDYQMQQVAQILAAQDFSATRLPSSRVPRLLPSIRVSHDTDDDLLVTVRRASGELLYASTSNRPLPGGMLPAFEFLGFRSVRLGQQTYRVFVARSGELQIQVAQSMEAIREAEGSIALATLLPITLLVPVLAAVIGFGIRGQLRPLNEAARTVALRPALSLELLPEERMPLEVRPFVEEINRLLRRLRTAVEREQRFVTDAAHALRTPLTALQLQAEILDGGRDPAERAARLEELRAGIRRLIRLSEQLLSLARSDTESGPSNATSDLDSMLREVVSVYGDTAQARGIDLQVETNTGAFVRGNSRRLMLIFGNLLDNSLRYTPAGGHVRVRASATEAQARVQVWDEGPGLAPQDLERVFERFYRAAGEQGMGSGLGLATVQALVEQLGGTVALENRVDHPGLVATVSLPLTRAADPSSPPNAHALQYELPVPPNPTARPALHYDDKSPWQG